MTRDRPRAQYLAVALTFSVALFGGIASQAPAATGVQLGTGTSLVEADPNAPDPVVTIESPTLPFNRTASSGSSVAHQETTVVDSGTGITLDSTSQLSGSDLDFAYTQMIRRFTITAPSLPAKISGLVADSGPGGSDGDWLQTVIFREVGGADLVAFNDDDDDDFEAQTELGPGTYELEMLGQCEPGAGETCTADVSAHLELGQACSSSEVRVGFATAEGCFTETAPGSGTFETAQKAWVGGFEIVPRPGGKLVLDVNARSVSESGAGVDVIFAGFKVPLPVSTLPVDVSNGSVDVNQPGTAEKAILELPVEGQAKVAWAGDGKSAEFEAEIKLDKLASPVGALVTTSSLTSIGQTGGKLKASLVNGQGFVLNSAEVAIQEISIIPRALRVPRTLTLRNLLLRFELRNQKPFWTGQAGIRMPLTRGALDVTGRVFVFDGSPAGGGLAIDGLNRPLGATPIFLQSVSGDLLFAPTFGYDLTVGGSLGPRVNNKQLLTLTGTMQGGETARADCSAGLDPSKLILSSKLTPLEPLVAAGLAEAEMSGRSCIYTGTVPAMELTAAVKIAFLSNALAYEASQTGFVSTNGANLEGDAIVKLPALPDLQGRAIISTIGLAACGAFGFFDGGFGHSWGAGAPTAFSGCDLGPFRVTATASARHARGTAPGTIDVPAGLPHAGFAATGTTGPPPVSVTGPGGFSVSSPTDGSALQSANAVIVPVAGEQTTYVFVDDPAAGTWNVDSADPANPLTRVSFAEGLPDPKVKGRVKTGPKKFKLRYSLREIPGQKVTLFERGEGIARKLGKATGDGGQISFKPTIATDRRRTIEAEVAQDGLPRDLITVAKFKAPKQPKIAKPRPKATRKKKSLSLAWPRVRGASEYIAEVSAGKEALFRVLTKKHRLRFAKTPKNGKLKVSVQALGEAQPPGRVAKLTVKKPKRG